MTNEVQGWRPRIRWIVLPCTLALVLGVGLAVTQFPAAGNDDSHITYWAAHALARLGRIVNYNGVALEQSSSLGLVLLLALIERLTGVTPPWSAWIISMVAAALAVIGAAVLGRRTSPVAGVIAPLVTVTALPLLYWSTSGMEMTLAAALGLAVIAAVSEHVDRGCPRWIPTTAMAAFALVRPESPIELLCTLVGATALGAIASKRTADDRGALAPRYPRESSAGSRSSPASGDAAALRRTLGLLGIGALLVIALCAVRYRAFGSIVPNPAHIKSGGFALKHGLAYLWKSLRATGPALIVAAGAGFAIAAAGALSGGKDTIRALTLSFAVADVAFVIGSGGDWMPAGRLLVPAIPVLALLAAQSIDTLFRRQRAVAMGAAVLVIALDVRAILRFAHASQNASLRGPDAGRAPAGLSPDGPRYAFSELANRGHRRDTLLLDGLLEAARRIAPTPERPLVVMSGQAGMVPYYLAREHYGSFEFLDLYGLTDTRLLGCAPRQKRHAGIHGIHLDVEYLLSHAEAPRKGCGFRRPDVIFSADTFPHYLSTYGYKQTYQGPHDLGGWVAMDARLADQLGL